MSIFFMNAYLFQRSKNKSVKLIVHINLYFFEVLNSFGKTHRPMYGGKNCRGVSKDVDSCKLQVSLSLINNYTAQRKQMLKLAFWASVNRAFHTRDNISFNEGHQLFVCSSVWLF